MLAAEATAGAVEALQRWAAGEPATSLEAAAGLVRWCGTHETGCEAVTAAFGHGTGMQRLKRIVAARSLNDATREHVAVLLRTLWTVTPLDTRVNNAPVDSPAAPPELAGRLRTEPLRVRGFAPLLLLFVLPAASSERRRGCRVASQDVTAVALLEAGVVQCMSMVLGKHVAEATIVLMGKHASPPLLDGTSTACPSFDEASTSDNLAALQVRSILFADAWFCACVWPSETRSGVRKQAAGARQAERLWVRGLRRRYAVCCAT